MSVCSLKKGVNYSAGDDEIRILKYLHKNVDPADDISDAIIGPQ